MKHFKYFSMMVMALAAQNAAAKLVELSADESFADIVKNNKYVVAKFATEWCQYCPQIKPIFEAAANDSQLEDVVFVEIDGDEFKDLVKKHKVSGFPKILYFKGGKQLDGEGRRSAAEQEETFKAEVKKKFGL